MATTLYWLEQDFGEVPDDNSWLGEGERAVVDSLRFSKRRDEWRLGRWTAKQAVCALLEKSFYFFPSLEILPGSDGAPKAFCQNDDAGVSLSISHCRRKGLCVAAADGVSVGCDIEALETREDGFIRDYFTAGEQAACRQDCAEKKVLISNLIWSAKESVLKIMKEGLRRDTRTVAIRVLPYVEEKQWNIWEGRCTESSHVFRGWWKVSDGLVYTMAAEVPTIVPEKLQECVRGL